VSSNISYVTRTSLKDNRASPTVFTAFHANANIYRLQNQPLTALIAYYYRYSIGC